MKNSVYPCLWFDHNAVEAASFYCSVFNNSVFSVDTPMVVTLKISGRKFMLMNGGPMFKMNPSVSFYVIYETEEELVTVWNQLLDGGFALMPLDKYSWSEKYGWLQDRFGVNWQLTVDNSGKIPQKVTPVLMFTGQQNGKAAQAIDYYTSIFEGSETIAISRYEKGENDVEGNIKHARFRLGDHLFMALESSHPHAFGFNEAISFVVECETQEEIDYYWEKLTDGGQEVQCGWLKDRFGISWQIIPAVLIELMKDPSRSGRVIQAFLQMKKFEIEKLLNA